MSQYATDKISSGYLRYYDLLFQPLVARAVTLLELGVHEGASMLLWKDYFPQGRIAGIDRKLPANLSSHERIALFQGEQTDTTFLSNVANKIAPDGFDIIIDDASHLAAATKLSFWHLFEHHLKPSGIYVIEDWGTGYWDDWPDGRSLPAKQKLFGKRHAPATHHNSGMVGFIKELIDEQGAADLTRGRWTGTPTRQSKFESMTIVPSMVFITKKSAMEDYS